ncbi:hypothetical protein [Bradyrhizobium liaoningense]|uniref:hypothetical protein n=1 Tax=Bradyrhizobium liaoningense TaxID=43992 RepID=UPI0005550F2E|nr:hypothetical protein [Bradyrhizobium liaoningense]
MSDTLWCPTCQQGAINEHRIVFAQRCAECGGLLDEMDENERTEVEFKEIDIGYKPEEEEQEETEKAEETEADAEAEAD